MKNLKQYIMKHISILNKGHFGFNHLWAKLQLEDINSTCSYDNGFVTCTIHDEYLSHVQEVVKKTLGDRLIIIFHHDDVSSASLARQIYWKQ
jgi:hypothetical protein